MMHAHTTANHSVMDAQIILQKKVLEKELQTILFDSADGLVPESARPEYVNKIILLYSELNKLSEVYPWLVGIRYNDGDDN